MSVEKRLTPNQIVAYNLRRAREDRGWTQTQAAEQLEPYLGKRWSTSTFSVAEMSVESGHRTREFTANDIVAFARAFSLPVTYFFLPPDEPVSVETAAAPSLSWGEAFELVLRATPETIGRLREILKKLPPEEQPDYTRAMQRYAGAVVVAAITSVLDRVGRTAADLEGLAGWLREGSEHAEHQAAQDLAEAWERETEELQTGESRGEPQ